MLVALAESASVSQDVLSYIIVQFHYPHNPSKVFEAAPDVSSPDCAVYCHMYFAPVWSEVLCLPLKYRYPFSYYFHSENDESNVLYSCPLKFVKSLPAHLPSAPQFRSESLSNTFLPNNFCFNPYMWCPSFIFIVIL